MKRFTRVVCVVLLILITVTFLALNIEGLIEIVNHHISRSKHHYETTVEPRNHEEDLRLEEERWRALDELRRKTSTTSTQAPQPPPSTTTAQPPPPPSTTTRRIEITTQRSTTPPWTTRSTTVIPRTSTTTERTTTTTTQEDLWTSTRIHVTRPYQPPVPVTVPRIEVTRPHHPHRHHGHHHVHHIAPITTSTSSSTSTSTSTSSSTTSTSTTSRVPSTTTTITASGMEPFEPPEITIVTALIDIGRGDWWEYRRPLEKYHEFMENLLSLRNNMVIFVDSASHDFVHKYRKNMGLMHKTKIHLVTINDLPLARNLPYAQKIIEDEMKDNELYRYDQSVRAHPEAKSAEYDVVVCSKTYFLYNATLEDPFNTENFAWIDAGYGHGNQSVYPYDSVWRPVFPKGKVSVIKLTPEHDLIKDYNIKNLYRRNWSVISGGFIGGDKRSLGQLHTIVHNKFIHLIYMNKVDDDQTLMVLAINSYPHLFAVRQGDWFDAFRLYSYDAEANFGR